MTVGKDVSGLF